MQNSLVSVGLSRGSERLLNELASSSSLMVSDLVATGVSVSILGRTGVGGLLPPFLLDWVRCLRICGLKDNSSDLHITVPCCLVMSAH